MYSLPLKPYRELGFLPVEVNASDTRNKSDKSALKGIGGKLSNGIRELATNTVISTGPDGKPARVRSNVCDNSHGALAIPVTFCILLHWGHICSMSVLEFVAFMMSVMSRVVDPGHTN